MADYDIIRDQTLMFFLDHLMGKGQSRTLHDLSCQFGAKGFTKEMRQIAGGSQAGLRKFLLQFPSLFTIDGDNVHLTPLTSDQNGSSVRDYTKETIEFFTEKLQSYGIAEVPLKSLFGHRSQASSEIRHVSGQNVKEFREFLQAHSSVFVVRDDYVVLQSVLDQLEQDGHNEILRRMPEEITHDPYLMQQLVNDLEDKVYNLTENYSNKISIDLLYNAMKSKEQLPPLWDDFVKVPTDLITFLHMNSRIFLVQGNMVSLTNERQIALRDKLKLQPSTNENVEHRTDQINSSQSSPVHNKKNVATQSNSNSRPATASGTSPSTMTFNQRIRSQIIKIVTQGANASMDNAGASRSNNLNTNNNNNNHNSDDSTDMNMVNSDNQYDSIDLQTIKPRIIVKNKECEMIVEDIIQHCSAIGFDVEGINLGLNGEVTLIQISYIISNAANKDSSSNRANIALFDVFLNPSLIQSGLKKLLESDKVVKVGHDVRTNSVSLHKSFGITLKNVFDTQVAHLILQQQTTGRPAYKPTKYISFYTLCNVYAGLNLNPKMKDRLHKLYRKDYKYWKNRPLTEEMLQFAVTEVYALYPSVYNKIQDQIRPEYEPLFEQLVYESVFAYINVDEIKQLKRQRKFELELTDLKLKLFNNDKKKIVLSNREIRLLRYIDLTDEIRNKIEGPLNVAKKLKRFDNNQQAKKSNGPDSANNGNMTDRTKDNGDSSGGDNNADTDEEEDEDDMINYEEYDKYHINMKNKHSSLSLTPPPPSREFDQQQQNSGEFMLETPNEPCCHCHCHNNRHQSQLSSPSSSSSSSNGQKSNTTIATRLHPVQMCDNSTQTLSTGDIVLTKIYVNHESESKMNSKSQQT